MAKINMNKSPLIGIAKFLENETKDTEKGRRMAKAILTRTVEKSKTATEEDKKEAEGELISLEERMREASAGRLSNIIIMKNPNDLNILKGLERMYIALPQYNLMKDNIKDHGVQVPIIITESDEIIDGRHRWMAAKELGMKEVPTILNTEARIGEIIRLMLSYNVCRRQITKEDLIHYVKILKELGKSKKGPGRPCEAGTKIIKDKPPSNREIAEELGVSPSTIDRVSRKEKSASLDADKKPPIPSVRREWEEEVKEFRTTVGKSKEKDEGYLIDIHRYIDAIFTNMQLEKGDKVEFIITARNSKKVEE